MNLNTQHYGRRLEFLILSLDKSKRDIADKMNISPSNISRWVKEPTFPDERLTLICKALEITEGQFLGTEEINLVVNEKAIEYQKIGDIQKDKDEAKEKEVGYLKKIIEEKERTIQILLKQLR